MSGAPKFSQSAEQIRGIASRAIGELEAELVAIAAIPAGKRTFTNTVLAFEAALDKLTAATQIPKFLALVSEEAEVRKASEELRVKMGQYSVELMTREDVFEALAVYAGKKEKLRAADALLLARRLRDFRKNGLGLEPRKKIKAGKILKDLVEINLEFNKNLRDVDDALEVTESELEGLPEDYKARLKRTASGGYLVTMNYPDYNPFMENSKSGDARRRLCRMYNSRCAGVNTRLLEKALALRRALAKLLGYDTYADFVLEERMAKSKETVSAFLKGLQRNLKKKALKELRARLMLKGGTEKELKAWETAYYTNLLRKSGYNLDHEKIKEYFPLETVLSGMFGVFGEILGVSIVAADIPVWHKDARAYEVRETDGSVSAYFYLDLFPRAGKYKHAVCSSLRERRTLPGGGQETPAAAIVANFTSPSGERPSLLMFSEVHTLFHEFGHVAQLLLSRAGHSRLSPVNAPWDFVEIPSTTFQQWAYEPSVLRRVSGHYKNKEQKLPEETVASLLAAKNMEAGLYYLRMIALATIDLLFHASRRKVDTARIYEKVMQRTGLVSMDAGTEPSASFLHIMGGYSSGYYSYLWAEAVAADIFGVFKESGVMSPAIGRRYRDLILAPGAAGDETARIEEFLGRQFDSKAFLASIGRA